jgi:hypothetical protein
MYWRPVLSAAIATSILAAGFVVALSVLSRQGAGAEEIRSLGVENASVQSTKPAETPISPAATPEHDANELSHSSVIVRQPIDLEECTGREVANPSTDLLSTRPACESYGTTIQFLSQPAEAAQRARQESKLLFLLHVSGNFEDAKFT